MTYEEEVALRDYEAAKNDVTETDRRYRDAQLRRDVAWKRYATIKALTRTDVPTIH